MGMDRHSRDRFAKRRRSRLRPIGGRNRPSAAPCPGGCASRSSRGAADELRFGRVAADRAALDPGIVNGTATCPSRTSVLHERVPGLARVTSSRQLAVAGDHDGAERQAVRRQRRDDHRLDRPDGRSARPPRRCTPWSRSGVATMTPSPRRVGPVVPSMMSRISITPCGAPAVIRQSLMRQARRATGAWPGARPRRRAPCARGRAARPKITVPACSQQRGDVELGEEAEPPEVHAHQRQVKTEHASRLGDQRAVAAEDDRQVRVEPVGQRVVVGLQLGDDVAVTLHALAHFIDEVRDVGDCGRRARGHAHAGMVIGGEQRQRGLRDEEEKPARDEPPRLRLSVSLFS